jgi:hypothetical protein
MGTMNKILARSIVLAKKMPLKAWFAAVILPGGLIVMNTYLIYKSLKKKKNT